MLRLLCGPKKVNKSIGTDETQMEHELAKWFSLSERWQAILLLDEADVYFEKRASGQLQRNSLVSAFLRSMEYYHGILFLTVGTPSIRISLNPGC